MTNEELKKTLSFMRKMVDETPDFLKHLDGEFWVLASLKDLYEMCNDYSQAEDADFSQGDFVETRKLIKSYVPISQFDQQRLKIDSTVFSGFYLAVEGYFISPELMKKHFGKFIRDVQVPTKKYLADHNLPDLRYETMQWVGSKGYGFVLKDTELNEFFDTWNSYEYFDL